MRGEQWKQQLQLSSKAVWNIYLSLSQPAGYGYLKHRGKHRRSLTAWHWLTAVISCDKTVTGHTDQTSWTMKEPTGSSQTVLILSHHEYIRTSTNFMAMLIPRHHFPVGTWPPAAGHNCHFRDGEVIWHLQDSSLCDCQQPPLCSYSYAEWPWAKASGGKRVCVIWWQLHGETGSQQPQLWKWFWEGKAAGLGRLKMPHVKERAGCASRAGLGWPCSWPCSCALSPCTCWWEQLRTDSWPWKWVPISITLSMYAVLID